MKTKTIAFLAILASLGLNIDAGNNKQSLNLTENTQNYINILKLKAENDLKDEQKVISQLLKKHKAEKYFDFESKIAVRKLSERFKLDEICFYKLFQIECGFNPYAYNKKSKAVGLIQFLPTTAQKLGTSTENILNMSVAEQCFYIEKYLKAYEPRDGYRNFENLYLAVFFPLSLQKPMDFILKTKYTNALSISKNNPSFDSKGNNDGIITKNEVINYIKG